MGNFPERNWSIILQQAWSMCLKDRIHSSAVGTGYNKNNFNGNFGKGKKDICKRFNKGLCTAGRGCKYNHRCLGCGKFGHDVHICRNKLSTNTGAGEGASASNSSSVVPAVKQ